MELTIRSFKKPPLQGGTLLLGIPHVGIGGSILTDYILEQLQMDQIACLDSPEFPPFAMIHRGKPRFPVRIHADPKTRVVLLRSELSPLPGWSRPLAATILDWAEAEGIKRVVMPDGLLAPAATPARRALGVTPRIWFVATNPATRGEALAAGIREFDQGVLGGVPATILLEGRIRKADVLTLLAEFHDPLDDAQAAYSLAQVVPRFVPGLQLDLAGLRGALGQIEGVVRALREEAEQAATQLAKDGRIPMMYG